MTDRPKAKEWREPPPVAAAGLNGEAPSGAKVTEEAVFQALLAKYRQALRTSAELETLKLTPRKALFSDWGLEGDIGFIFGLRGSGKTWFTDAIAAALSTGGALDDWEAPAAVNVLYVDGEMVAENTRDRFKGLSPGNHNLRVLHHELLFDGTGLTINLMDPDHRAAVTALCEAHAIKALILDNQSCLFPGLNENDPEAWNPILPWLLDLRRKRIAVIIVHHANRAGGMRGHSKKEDPADWILKVEEYAEPTGKPADRLEVRFETTFEKQRAGKRQWAKRWHFQTDPATGRVSIACQNVSFDEKVFECVKADLSSASAIAEELKSSKATVSRAARRLADQKLIDIQGKRYVPRGPAAK